MGLKADIVLNGQAYKQMPDFITNDYGFKLNFEIENDDGSAHDLTGKTVQFKMRQINTTTLKVDETATNDVVLEGKASYTTQAADFNTTGVYDAELEVIEAGTSTQSINLGRFRITSEL